MSLVNLLMVNHKCFSLVNLLVATPFHNGYNNVK